jgi:hypothetical protein
VWIITIDKIGYQEYYRGMRQGKKRGKKRAGGAGGQPPAVVGRKRGAEEATDEGKGQELVVAGRGLAQGAGRRALTALEFQGLAAVPHEAEWFANIDNPRTRRAYRIDIHEFMGFVGIERPEEFRTVTRSHVLVWRKDLEGRELRDLTTHTSIWYPKKDR